MGNSVSAFGPNAKVFVLIDSHVPPNSKVHPKKSLIQINDLITLSTTVDCEDSSGGASMSFNDMDMRFWKYYPLKYLYTKTFNDNLVSANSPFIKLKDSDKSVKDDKLNNIQYFLRNKTEIAGFRKDLAKYGRQHVVYEALDMLLAGYTGEKDDTDFTEGGVLEPLIDVQNLVWVFMMGRDGYWYPKFAGLVTSIKYSDPAGETPRIDIGAKPFTRLFEYSKIATGLPNLGDIKSVENLALKNQYEGLTSGLAFNNILALKKTAAEVIFEALKICNNFFLQNFQDTNQKEDVKTSSSIDISEDLRYFRLNNLFEIPTGDKVIETKKDENGNDVDVETYPPKTYLIDDPAFTPHKYFYDEDIQTGELYNGSDIPPDKLEKENTGLVKNCLSKVIMLNDFSLSFKPYQNLIRTNIQLGVLDSKTIRDVLDVVKKTTLCYIYCDGDGNLKIERPNFDLSPWGDFNETQKNDGTIIPGYIPSPKNATEKGKQNIPIDYDGRYIMCRKDLSYLDSDYERVESSIITRISTWMQQDFLTFDDIVTKALFAGKSESSPKVYNKFGLREVVLDPIVRADFFKSEDIINILNSYAEGMKIQLNAKAVPVNFVLDQRPDLHVNRNLYYLDKGIATLITSLTDTIDFDTGKHTTYVRGNYTRPIGYPLINPFRFIINKDANGQYVLEEFAVTPIDLTKKVNPLSIKKEIFDSSAPNSDETYEKILADMEIERGNNNFSSSDFKKYVTDALEQGKVVGYSIIRRNTPGLGFNNTMHSVMYFLYKQNGKGEVIKFLTYSHPTQEGDIMSTGRYSKYTQLAAGFYNYEYGQKKVENENGKWVPVFCLFSTNFWFEFLDKDLKLIQGRHESKEYDKKMHERDYKSTICSGIWDIEHAVEKNSQYYSTFWSGVSIGCNSGDWGSLTSKLSELKVTDVWVMNVYSNLSPDQRTTDKQKKEAEDNKTKLNEQWTGDTFTKTLIYANDLAKWGKIRDYKTSSINYDPANFYKTNPFGFTEANLASYVKSISPVNGIVKLDKEVFDTIIATYKNDLNSLLGKGRHPYKGWARWIVEERGVKHTDNSFKDTFMWVANEYYKDGTNMNTGSLYPRAYGESINTDSTKGELKGRLTYSALIGLLHWGVITSGVDLKTLSNLTSITAAKNIFTFLRGSFGLYLDEIEGDEQKATIDFFKAPVNTWYKLKYHDDFLFFLFKEYFISPWMEKSGNIIHRGTLTSAEAWVLKNIPKFKEICKTYSYQMWKGVTQKDENDLKAYFF